MPTFLNNLVSLNKPIQRREYVVSGFVFAILKFSVELSIIWYFCSILYSPLEFISPFLSSREKYLELLPTWVGWAWALWTVPFLWVGVNMSVRRAVDAGISPWWGLIILVPFVNLIGILVLSLLPRFQIVATTSRNELRADPIDLVSEIYSPSSTEAPRIISDKSNSSAVVAAFVGWIAGSAYLLTSVVLSVYVLNSYGTAMFFGAPILTCAVSAYAYNRGTDQGLGWTLFHSIGTLTIASLGFLIMGLEGAICIAMAIPVFVPIGMMGSFIGYGIAVSLHRPERDESKGLIGCIAILPVIAILETVLDESPTVEARTSIIVEAPIASVWECVIDFPEITEPPTGLLSLGIAYPINATIDGKGVGAIRHCNFTTGSFVEPITVWDEPNRLAFDVSSQPEPMSELSPYRHIHPPHLDGSFRSIRGEFRLDAINENRTKLEGSTWYKIDMGPRVYWRLWTDLILHRIHDRVLCHVKTTAENR